MEREKTGRHKENLSGQGREPKISSTVICQWVWCPFFENPENFSCPKSHSKILNLTITELFYSYIRNMSSGSLFTGSFRRVRNPLCFKIKK